MAYLRKDNKNNKSQGWDYLIQNGTKAYLKTNLNSFTPLILQKKDQIEEFINNS